MPTAPAITTTVGIRIAGGFGATPTLTVPATAAPAALTQQTITQGTGAEVAKGDTLVANYLGETWAPKSGKANVFDSSFSRGAPAAFVIGVGQVVPGWDKSLVGQKLGTRMLLTLPPADGYGSRGQSDAGITATDTLVFVVDLIAAYEPDASAPGTVVNSIPAGLPKVTNEEGRPPTITSTAGVLAPTKPMSTLLVTGTGVKIDSAKTLVLQVVETDLATGKHTESTWGTGPQAVPASSVFDVADVLSASNIGSRALVLLPPTAAVAATATAAAQAATPAEVLVIDVVGQF